MRSLYKANEFLIRFVLPVGAGGFGIVALVAYISTQQLHLAITWAVVIVLSALIFWLANGPKARKQWREHNGRAEEEPESPRTDGD